MLPASGKVISTDDKISLDWTHKQKKMRKSTVIESISGLPDEFSIDEIIERLIIIEKIDKGRQQVKDGKINTEEQAKEKLSKWVN